MYETNTWALTCLKTTKDLATWGWRHSKLCSTKAYALLLHSSILEVGWIILQFEAWVPIETLCSSITFIHFGSWMNNTTLWSLGTHRKQDSLWWWWVWREKRAISFTRNTSQKGMWIITCLLLKCLLKERSLYHLNNEKLEGISIGYSKGIVLKSTLKKLLYNL